MMSTSISFTAAFSSPLSMNVTPSRSVAQPATASSPATEQRAAAVEPTTHEDVQRDSSGLTVFRTIDLSTGALVAQFPTEAYLRLANAMKDVARGPAATDTPSARTV
jgi:hypothetical protein